MSSYRTRVPKAVCRYRSHEEASPNPTSSLSSAPPGSRRLSRTTRRSPLVSRRHAALQMRAPAPRNARACTVPNVRQFRCRVLAAHPTLPNLLSQANLDAKGCLEFLSVSVGLSPPLIADAREAKA